jgi:hypothetical protein
MEILHRNKTAVKRHNDELELLAISQAKWMNTFNDKIAVEAMIQSFADLKIED